MYKRFFFIQILYTFALVIISYQETFSLTKRY